jgi:hypothetical protein
MDASLFKTGENQKEDISNGGARVVTQTRGPSLRFEPSLIHPINITVLMGAFKT